MFSSAKYNHTHMHAYTHTHTTHQLILSSLSPSLVGEVCPDEPAPGPSVGEVPSPHTSGVYLQGQIQLGWIIMLSHCLCVCQRGAAHEIDPSAEHTMPHDIKCVGTSILYAYCISVCVHVASLCVHVAPSLHPSPSWSSCSLSQWNCRRRVLRHCTTSCPTPGTYT